MLYFRLVASMQHPIIKMLPFIFYVTFLLLSLPNPSSAAVSIPPKITLFSPRDIYYKVNETVKIMCEASGRPHPGFSWKRQEIDFNPAGNDDRITQVTNKGTLIINSPEDKDEGIYQCFAKNDLGTAVSVKFNLRMAKLSTFKNDDKIEHRVDLGSYLRMSCQSPDSVPDPDIYWVVEQKDGGYHVLDWNSTVSMDYEDGIHFAHVTSLNAQGGQAYRCIVYNPMMRASQVGPPQYIIPRGSTEQLRDITFVWPMSRFSQQGLVGSSKTLKCIFAGNPTPIVRWRRPDNKPIPMNRATTANSDGQELVIRDLHFDDAGSYVCEATAEGSAKPVQQSFNLTVNARPTWIKKPKDVETGEGATAVFECSANGTPPPDIIWLVNGVGLQVALATDTRLNSRFQRLEPTKIILEKVTKNDNMVFQCNATNVHGYLWGEAYLNVLDEKPSILEVTGKVVKVAEGQPFEVKCRVTGKPDPIITWYKNGIQITGGRYVIRESGDMAVDTAVLSDAGVFSCYAENKNGHANAEAGTVLVRRKTIIEQEPRDLEVMNTAYAKFTCSGTTDPEETPNLRVIWMKDYKAVEVGERFFVNPQDNSLILSGAQVRDTGTLTCVLTNGLDNDTASARLEVTDKPDTPYDMNINNTCKTNSTAEVLWTPGSFNNAPIQYFLVEYSTTKDPDNWSFSTKTSQTKSKAFIKLAPGLDYRFRVMSVNRVGSSAPSLPTTKSCVTESSAPLQNPKNVRTLGDLPGKIHLEWTPVLPKYQGGIQFHYFLIVREMGVTDGSSIVATRTISDWKTSSVEIRGMSSDYQPYRITIKSVNEIGDAKETLKPIIGHSAESMPIIPPANLQTDEKDMKEDSVLLQWTFPRSEIGKPGSQIKGQFAGFQVQMWEQGNRLETVRQWMLPASYFVPSWANSSVLSTWGNRFNATVRHMLPNTYVEATVAVVNNFFIGGPSDTIRFRTLPGLPGPVSFMDAVVIGDNHVTIRWDRPLDDRTDIIGYDIGYQRVVRGLELDEMQELQPPIDDPYATDAIVNGLLPLTKYRIHIWAKTKAGRGESYFIERTTSAPKTLTLPRFNIVNVGKDHINVSWWTDKFAESGSVVFVEYKKQDSAEWFSTTPDMSRSWADVTLLQAGMTYQVRVVVTNGDHRLVSVEEDVDTDGDAPAYDVVENLGWFLAIIFSLLIHIGLIILFCIGYKRGFRLKSYEERNNVRTYKEGGNVYIGTAYNTDRIGGKSEDFGPEPRGHTNDYYEERDNYEDGNDFDDGGARGDYYGDDEKPPLNNYDDYEGYDNQYDNNYDDDEDVPVKPGAYSSEGSWERNRDNNYDRDYGYDDHRRPDYDDRGGRPYGNNNNNNNNSTGRGGRYNDDDDEENGDDDNRYYGDENGAAAASNTGRRSNQGYHQDSDYSDREHDRSRDNGSRNAPPAYVDAQGSSFV